MGSSQSKPGPAQDHRDPTAPQAQSAPGVHPRLPSAASRLPSAAPRVPSAATRLPSPAPRHSRRPSSSGLGAPGLGFIIAPRRRPALQQARYSKVGVLPNVCLGGCYRKPVLTTANAGLLRRGTVRIPPPDRRLTRSPKQIISLTSSSQASNTPEPEPFGLSVSKERKKRMVEEEDHASADGQDSKRRCQDSSGSGLPASADGQDSKRRCQDSSGSGLPASQPPEDNGDPTSVVPEPGPLESVLTRQDSEDHLNPLSGTSCVSFLPSKYTAGIPCPRRNAITNSYSSTAGLRKRRLPEPAPLSSPASSDPQTQERPAKKTRAEVPLGHHASSVPLVVDREDQGERKEHNSLTAPSTPGSSRPGVGRSSCCPPGQGPHCASPSPVPHH